jgi:hypothetical protein
MAVDRGIVETDLKSHKLDLAVLDKLSVKRVSGGDVTVGAHESINSGLGFRQYSFSWDGWLQVKVIVLDFLHPFCTAKHLDNDLQRRLNEVWPGLIGFIVSAPGAYETRQDLFGVDTLTQLEENLAIAARGPLPDELMAAIESCRAPLLETESC